jgi:hypothetical protein
MRITSWEEVKCYEDRAKNCSSCLSGVCVSTDNMCSKPDDSILYHFRYPSGRQDYINGGFPNVLTIITIEGRGRHEFQRSFGRVW